MNIRFFLSALTLVMLGSSTGVSQSITGTIRGVVTLLRQWRLLGGPKMCCSHLEGCQITCAHKAFVYENLRSNIQLALN